jgi:predicted SprT family Zn-dependent metalloprotease
MKRPADGTPAIRHDARAITPIEYGSLQDAFDHFNRELFAGELPDLLIDYQRRARTGGYFSPERFSARGGDFRKHELALNPDAFVGKSDEFICSTLVHEMTHEWQQEFGTPPKRAYHNKEWAAKMKSIGLQPAANGMVGDKETGQAMSHYIIPDGAFTKVFAALAATGWKLNLQSAHRPGKHKGPNSKTKFTCTSCGQNAWGKPDLDIMCRPCGLPMLDAAAAGDLRSYDQAAE